MLLRLDENSKEAGRTSLRALIVVLGHINMSGDGRQRARLLSYACREFTLIGSDPAVEHCRDQSFLCSEARLHAPLRDACGLCNASDRQRARPPLRNELLRDIEDMLSVD